MKHASHGKINTAGFHLHEVFKIVKFTELERNDGWQRPRKRKGGIPNQ